MADRLQEALLELQVRFGDAAPRPVGSPAQSHPSGVPEIDDLVGIGGWPAGRLSLLSGSQGSGKRTLALRSVAAASREAPVAYVDARCRLDPQFLVSCGGVLDRLLVVRPRTLAEGLESASVLSRAGVDLVCLDLGPEAGPALDAGLPLLLHRAAESGCTVLLMDGVEPEDAVRYYASVIVRLERRGWVFSSAGDLRGIEVEAAVVKNRLAPPGRSMRWLLEYPKAAAG